jgi:hypothetical protein
MGRNAYENITIYVSVAYTAWYWDIMVGFDEGKSIMRAIGWGGS